MAVNVLCVVTLSTCVLTVPQSHRGATSPHKLPSFISILPSARSQSMADQFLPFRLIRKSPQYTLQSSSVPRVALQGVHVCSFQEQGCKTCCASSRAKNVCHSARFCQSQAKCCSRHLQSSEADIYHYSLGRAFALHKPSAGLAGTLPFLWGVFPMKKDTVCPICVITNFVVHFPRYFKEL